eukprot:768416-Hanusia_phi.AAC.2
MMMMRERNRNGKRSRRKRVGRYELRTWGERGEMEKLRASMDLDGHMSGGKDDVDESTQTSTRDVTIDMATIMESETFASQQSTPSEEIGTEIHQKDDIASLTGSDVLPKSAKAKSSSGFSSASFNFWENYTTFKPEDIKAFDDEDDESGIFHYVSDMVTDLREQLSPDVLMQMLEMRSYIHSFIRQLSIQVGTDHLLCLYTSHDSFPSSIDGRRVEVESKAVSIVDLLSRVCVL